MDDQTLIELSNKKDEMMNSIIELQTRYENLIAAITDISEQASQRNSIVESLNREKLAFEELMKEIRSAEKELSLKNEELSLLSKKISSINNDVGVATDNFESSRSIFSAKIIALSEEKSNKEKEVELVRTQKLSLQEDIERITKVKEVLENSTNKDLSLISEKVSLASAELVAIESKISSKKSEISKLEDSLQSLSDKSVVTEKTLSSTNSSLSVIMVNIEDLEKQKSGLLGELSTLSLSISEKREIEASVAKEIEEINSKKDAAEAELEASMNKVALFTKKGDYLAEKESYIAEKFAKAGFNYKAFTE